MSAVPPDDPPLAPPEAPRVAAPAGSPAARPRTALHLPRAALSGCLQGALLYDARGLVQSEPQRMAHLPASPMCALVWWFHGGPPQLLDAAGEQADWRRAQPPLPSEVMFFGLSTRPVSALNGPETEGLQLLILPDALQPLAGIDPTAWIDRHAPAHEVFDADWRALFDAVRAAPAMAQRLALIEDFLEPRWQAARPRAPAGLLRIRDWTETLARRAALSGTGRSLRQVERRIKGWSGLPLRELRRLARAEDAFFEVRDAQRAGPVSWADVAAASGYADQSHLCRETRRSTGFTPEALRRGIDQDEPAFWVYRLWM